MSGTGSLYILHFVFSLYVCMLSLLLYKLPILFMGFEGVDDIWYCSQVLGCALLTVMFAICCVFSLFCLFAFILPYRLLL